MKALLFGSVLASLVAVGAAVSSVASASTHVVLASAVPELDPSAAASVVSLALAAALVLSHRRRNTATV